MHLAFFFLLYGWSLCPGCTDHMLQVNGEQLVKITRPKSLYYQANKRKVTSLLTYSDTLYSH